MDLSVFKIRGAGAFAALLATSIIGTGTMQAIQTVVITGGPAAVTCNTATGPGAAATITVKLGTALVGLATEVVTVSAPGGGLVVTPLTQTFALANNTAGLTFSINTAAGCVGNATGATTLTITPTGGTANSTLVVNDVVTATTSALNASPVIFQCIAGGVPGRAQTVSVVSAATGGTPFTLDPLGSVGSDAALAAWAVVNNGYAGGTANATGASFQVQANASGDCGGYALGSTHTTYLYLDNAPAPAVKVSITINVVSASPLSATYTPSNAQLTYVKGSEAAGYVDVAVTSIPASLYVTVGQTPNWLVVNLPSSHAAPNTFRFTSTAICDSLAPGSYSATIYLSAYGYADTPIVVNMLLTNKAPTLSINLTPYPGLVTTGLGASTATNQNINWVYNSPNLPAPIITLVSSDSPIPYTTVTAGVLAPVISSIQETNVAFNTGTAVNVSFNNSVFASAVPGTVLTGTVTFTSGTPASSITVTLNVTVQSAGAIMTSILPASVPTGPPGSVVNVTLNGSGFVVSSDPTVRTKVGVVIAGVQNPTDTNFAYTVTPSTITLTITVPGVGSDSNLAAFAAAAGGTINIGVCNPAPVVGCTAPTGQEPLIVAPGPIIQAVTSASAFTEVAPGTVPVTAAYDMLSVFGNSFCSSTNTGCSSSQILYATPDAITQRYPTSLTPDTSGTIRNLTVTFYNHGGAWIGNAPLLFATNSQINLLVPAAVTQVGIGTVDLVVSFVSGALPTSASVEPTAATTTAAIYNMSVAATDPGVFTVGADGQGLAAVLNANTYAEITQVAPAGMRATATKSDTVAFYVTGLGIPDSVAANATGGGNVNITDCIAATGAGATVSYEGALQNSIGSTPVLTTIDGAIIQQSLIDPTRLPPCMATTTGGDGSFGSTVPSVTIGGVLVPSGNIGFAGFVDSAVAGLYQINVTLPSTVSGGSPEFTDVSGALHNHITAATQLPVVITSNAVASQAGVSIWVAPRLYVVPPANLVGPYSIAWGSGAANTISAGTGNLEGVSTYAFTQSGLPTGLTIGAGTGLIAGTPTVTGAFPVTVSVTDSSAPTLSGTTTFTLTVGLDVIQTPAALLTGFPSATLSAGITTVSATGGNSVYTFTPTVTITSGGGVIGDVTFNGTNTVVGLAATCAANTTYHIVYAVNDSTSPTENVGTITFDITTGA
ncbi:MAG: hypothetical protein ABSB15_17105 [Bryobacteraceae bacterium]|jgi:hypothetical protein